MTFGTRLIGLYKPEFTFGAFAMHLSVTHDSFLFSTEVLVITSNSTKGSISVKIIENTMISYLNYEVTRPKSSKKSLHRIIT